MLRCKQISAPMLTPCKLSIEDAPRTVKERDEMLNVPYKQILGCKRYLVSCTRPDLCFTAGILTGFNARSRTKTLASIKTSTTLLKTNERYGVNLL